MKSWLNSLNLKLIQIQLQICYSGGIYLLIQSNNDAFFAVISLPGSASFKTAALPLLSGHLLFCCYCTCWMLHTAMLGGHGGPFKHMVDVTGVEICQACLSATMKETLETQGPGTQNSSLIATSRPWDSTLS